MVDILMKVTFMQDHQVLYFLFIISGKHASERSMIWTAWEFFTTAAIPVSRLSAAVESGCHEKLYAQMTRDAIWLEWNYCRTDDT